MWFRGDLRILLNVLRLVCKSTTIEQRYSSGGRGESSVVSFVTQRDTGREALAVHIMVTENEITTELFVIEKEEGIVTNKIRKMLFFQVYCHYSMFHKINHIQFWRYLISVSYSTMKMEALAITQTPKYSIELRYSGRIGAVIAQAV